MESEILRKKPHNMAGLEGKRIDVAFAFASSLKDKYKDLVTCAIITRKVLSSPSIDLIIVVDDLSKVVMNPVVAKMRIDACEIAFKSAIPVNFEFMLVSEFWSGIKSKDSSILDILRKGFIVFDNGFLYPLQDLLVTGKIRPTKESVNIYFMKAERSLKVSCEFVHRAVMDLYWAVIDSAHAAVMVAGHTPPLPKDLAGVFRSELVVRNLVHKKCADIIDRIVLIAKRITHKEIFEITGKEYDMYLADANFFVGEIESFVDKYVRKKR